MPKNQRQPARPKGERGAVSAPHFGRRRNGDSDNPAVGLFAASPYTRQAQAIDANISGGTNASLNPTFMGLNQIGYCARLI